MLTVVKQFKWAMAHRLLHHDGLCSNNHGHTYMMEVGVVGEMQTVRKKEGMILDFKDLKELVQEEIIDKLDHATMVWEQDKSMIEFLERDKQKHVVVSYRPTAENMAKDFYQILKYRFGQSTKDLLTGATIPRKNGKLKFIRVWETDTSYAEYSED